MVRVRDYVNKDGETKHEIKLAGMGEEEEVKLTIKVDEVYEGEIPAGVSKKTGKPYSAFKTYGVGAIYHKDGAEIDTWVKLTPLSAKELRKTKFQQGDVVVAFKKPGKKGDYVSFRKEGEPVVDDHSAIKTELVEAVTPASDNLFAEATSFESQLVAQALGQGLTPEEIKLNFVSQKELGKDVLDCSIERVNWLIQREKIQY